LFSQDIEPYQKNQRNYHCQEIVPVILSRNLHIIAAEMKRREGNILEAGALLQSLPALYPEKKEALRKLFSSEY